MIDMDPKSELAVRLARATTDADRFLQQVREMFDTAGIPTPLADIFVRKLSVDGLRAEAAVMYAEHFSEDHLRSIAEFYESPAGQAWLDKMSLMTTAMQRYTSRVLEATP